MKKILIVEDEESLARALSDKLSQSGFEVILAKNGKEGFDVAIKDRPDLILLDIVMPVMDGLTMMNILRHHEWGRNVPVIMLTNLTGSDEVSKAITNNAFDYLVKTDWRLEDVVKKVKSRLNME